MEASYFDIGERETYEKIHKQGLDYNYASDNPIASKYIEWLNEWAIETIKNIDEFIDNGNIKGLKSLEEVHMAINLRNFGNLEQRREEIHKNILYYKCFMLEKYIPKIESTLNEPNNFEFFDIHQDLYKKALICVANNDYEGNHYYSCILEKYKIEFDKMKEG